MAIDLGAVGKSIANAMSNVANYSSNAAARANNISQQAQSAQGAFNQNSANIANEQNLQNMMSQYQFNSAQAANANAFTQQMWSAAADWNESMWQKQADFNAEQAEINRRWQERMDNTKYQRAMADMQAAGLNPILASGGVGAAPSGSVASVGGAQMSSAQGVAASGGLLGANAASESSYMGTMEQMGTTLALLGAVMSGLSSATDAASQLGDGGQEMITEITDALDESRNPVETAIKDFKQDMPLLDVLLHMTPGIGAGYAAITDLAATGLPTYVVTKLRDEAVKKYNSITHKTESAVPVDKAAKIIIQDNKESIIKNYKGKG